MEPGGGDCTYAWPRAPVAQSAEADPLKGSQCGFESHRGHVRPYKKRRATSYDWRMAAESRNPFLRRELGDQGYATFNQAPSQTATVDAAATQASPQQLQEMYDRTTTGQRMTLDDVVVKTSILFLILLAGATVGWVVGNSLLTFGSMIVALVFGLIDRVQARGQRRP